MVKNLHKEYRRGQPQCLGLKRSGDAGDAAADTKVAVVNSSFAVDAGEIFGLLGPNGAGKSTTLNAIVAETRPTSGQVGTVLHTVHTCHHRTMRRTSLLLLHTHTHLTALFPGLPR